MRSLIPFAPSVLTVTAALVVAVLAPSAAATAEPDMGRVEMAVVRAGALADDPLYVSPVHESELSGPEQARLRDRLEEAGVPVYIVLVDHSVGLPRYTSRLTDLAQVSGYVFVVGRDGRTLYGGRPGLDGARDQDAPTAASVVDAVNADPDLSGAPLADRLDRAVELAEGGSLTDRASWILPLASSLAGLALAGAALWFGVRRWSRRAIRVAPLTTRIVQDVDQAQQNEYRDRLTERLTGCGHRVSSVHGDSVKVESALEAYSAAAKILDTATDKSDLVGVQVLLDLCEAALNGEPRPGHCFFDPRHPGGTAHVRWRSPGSFESVRVLACRACRDAVKGLKTPLAVMDSTGARPRPYYSAGSSVWAATGYGTLSSDLPQRVLSGEHRR